MKQLLLSSNSKIKRPNNKDPKIALPSDRMQVNKTFYLSTGFQSRKKRKIGNKNLGISMTCRSKIEQPEGVQKLC